MRPSAVLQHIQHIAALGLPDGVAIPEIIATLKEAVPAAYGSFYWIDPVGNAYDFHAPSSVLDEMARNSVDFLSLDVTKEPALNRVVAIGQVVDNASVMRATCDFSQSVMVNEVMPKMSAAIGLDMVVRRDGEAKAVLYLNRHVSDPEFSSAEKRFLASIHPYVAHAVGAREGMLAGAIDPDAEREGTLTVTMTGEILALAGDALEILADIPERRRAWRTVGDTVQGFLPEALSPLLVSLAQAMLGRPAPPARLTLRRRWGEFRIRAYPLLSARGEPSGVATIVMSHHLPREVRMLRRVGAMNLSPVERRVAYHMGEGKTPGEVAGTLGVSAHTLRGYLKSTYARTGTTGREDLAALVRGE